MTKSGGITQFDLAPNGKALVSDDTQMSLFTANGMLMGLTRGHMRGIGGPPETYVTNAYADWYYTQVGGEKPAGTYTWLRDLPEMAHRRAPGGTCMEACRCMADHKDVHNNSKGCGGVMRVAPMALLMAGYAGRNCYPYDPVRIDMAGAHIARVTHLHPLGFLPAAMLTHLIYQVAGRAIDEVFRIMPALVDGCIRSLDYVYEGKYEEKKRKLVSLTRRAIELAQGDGSDEENIRLLGEGWVAEETWAIALYCAVRHIGNPYEAIVAAVNHDGDSDSTGAVCGNIVGAIYGYEYFKRNRMFCPEGRDPEDVLELSHLILPMADDLYTGCIISEYDPMDTPEKQQWYYRYCRMLPYGIARP